jgi:GNAT superfamily N-acetyltransferase
MIDVREVANKKELKTFVKFPFGLYKGSKYWVPPIIKDELETFDKDKNPAFLDAEARFFLAYKNGKIVGRVAAIVNWIEVKKQKLSKMRFGWFDMIDDLEVSGALLAKVAEIGQAHKLEYMEGPVGFSNLDKVGVLTEGFNHIGTMITWYNHPYYEKHLIHHGLVKEKEYLENKFPFENVKPKFFERVQNLVKKRYQLRQLNFTKTKDIMPYVDQMFDLFNESYASLSSFVPINDIQKAYFKERYLNFINPEFIKFVVDKDDQLVAFAIVMPSFAEALQKMKGKLFPFGIFHLLKARKKPKNITFYLIGVHPEYQNKGLTAILFMEYYLTFTEKKIEHCIRTPELIENTAIHQLWKHFEPVTHKRRKTYKKSL